MNKVTVGFVVQDFDGETGICKSQEFIAGDDVSWEDDYGNSIKVPRHEYFHFDMKQPIDKYNTVNVIEMEYGTPTSITSYPDDGDGNKNAKKMFKDIIKLNDRDISDSEIEIALENGTYDMSFDKQVVLIHSN